MGASRGDARRFDLYFDLELDLTFCMLRNGVFTWTVALLRKARVFGTSIYFHAKDYTSEEEIEGKRLGIRKNNEMGTQILGTLLNHP